MMSAFSQYLLQWQTFFQELGVLGLLAYVLLIVVIQMCCAPLSPVGIAAGLIFGLTRGFLVIEVGTALGAAVNFLLARYFMRRRVARWLGSNEKFLLIDAAIGREGWKIVALLRLCPIPFGIANYSYGLTAVRFVPYLLATLIAILPANFFFVWFGATSHDALATISSGSKTPPGQMIFTGIGLVAFFLALSYITRIARAALGKKSGPPAVSPAP
jgi:uncharacterized membrane protein YdjX (TVP38/TMEM64 family)